MKSSLKWRVGLYNYIQLRKVPGFIFFLSETRCFERTSDISEQDVKGPERFDLWVQDPAETNVQNFSSFVSSHRLRGESRVRKNPRRRKGVCFKEAVWMTSQWETSHSSPAPGARICWFVQRTFSVRKLHSASACCACSHPCRGWMELLPNSMWPRKTADHTFVCFGLPPSTSLCFCWRGSSEEVWFNQKLGKV